MSSPLSLLQTEEALEDAVYLVLSEMHKDGVIYAELRFAPQLHTQKGMTQETCCSICNAWIDKDRRFQVI
ncbi:MAG: hypothetical protein ACLTQN_01890 [Blautia massiliensis (ex Durand et al. 2017)]